MHNDLRKAVDESPMNRFQWTAIIICIALNMLDGFDVLVMAFTAASVSAEWKLSGSQLGLLLSAGLLGMAAGSLFIAPWADRFGRRPLILFCVTLAGAGMLLSALTQTPLQLAVLRAITGLGIGGILASSNVIASEYSSKRWRGLAVTLQSTGYALGATIGGLIAVALLSAWGWRSVFIFGGLATFAIIPFVLWRLPESLDFLLARRPANALERINVLARKLGHTPLAALPSLPTHGADEVKSSSFKQLFAPRLLRTTLLIWASFFLAMFGFYFIMSWTPKLLVSAGMSAQQGVTGGVLLSIGGIFGAALIGMLAARFKISHLLAVFMACTAVLLSVFVSTTSSLTAAFVMGLLIGLFSNGCIAGLYALASMAYDASVRATGMGWSIGMGRFGAIISPLVAGGLIDLQWGPNQLYQGYAVIFVIAAATVLLLKLSAPARPLGAPSSAH
ncbi:benzoate transport [Pseudomonas duriflava]|uniref:Benzoate transport n=1 Tax=Pseudomonas duriflava TaxID=459528 RepID=A0A562Q6I4_9PSED|nr:MFS transporter [Pseudomonas duriflava]TWI52362.1 benzoate transport [Pseudomonas duriflava]